MASSPQHLYSLLKVLQAQGNTLLSPSDRANLHPLVVPLCEVAPTGGATGSEGSQVVGLLRWPQPKQHRGMEMPVVATEHSGRRLRLLGRSVGEYLHRLLAEEDSSLPRGASRPLQSAAGPECDLLYPPGGVEQAGLADKLNMYIIRKIGLFPDVCEGLAEGHLSRGDQTSALVACEWYMRNNHFPGWGKPYEFAAEIFQRLKRLEECRDTTRAALGLPWWTLQAGFETLRSMAQVEGSPQEVKYLLSDEAAKEKMAQRSNNPYKEPKAPQQVALDRATDLLDFVAAGAIPSYSDVAEEVAVQYQEAGLTDVANFIKAA